MSRLSQLEDSLNDIFGKSAPKLPESGKKFLVQYLPILTLLGGLLAFWAAWALWHTAHRLDGLADSLNSIYGNTVVQTNRLTLVVWLAIIVLLVEAVMYLFAYSGLRDRKKAGWNLLFYVALLNVAYGVVRLFTDYDGIGSLIGAIIGSAIGLYFLFQIRDSYKAVTPAKPADTSSTTPAPKE